MRKQTHILLVEDDLDDQEFFRQALSEAAPGAVLEIASNSQEALTRLAGMPPLDAIVVDINMPGLSGIELCRLLHGEPRLGDVPVYVLTTASDPATRRQCKDAGATSVFCKPAGQKELYNIVRKIIGGE